MRLGLILAVLLAFLSPAQAHIASDFDLYLKSERGQHHSKDSFVGDPAWVDAEANPRFGEAAEEYKAGNYGNAARLLPPLAEEGNVKAQLLLGMLLHGGLGVERDVAQGISLIERAADQGLSTAKLQLAFVHLRRGEEDLGFQLLEQIANEGHVFAQIYLGVLYAPAMSDGPGHEKKSFDWFLKAAEAGDTFAMGQVAERYFTGVGDTFDEAEVEPDIVEAVRWGLAAADLNDPGGQFVLGWIYTRACSLEEKWTNLEKGVALFRQAAEQGHVRAQNRLASAYRHGNGVTKNLVTAYMWAKLTDRVPGFFSKVSDLASEMTPEQIAKGEQRAREWLEEHGPDSP